ncbi:MAG: hypothetical protein K0R18_3070 [Bacillales bacterium]|jgi:hypothetical protein|nr:hypothetical protein [Bacillales bacterium]
MHNILYYTRITKKTVLECKMDEEVNCRMLIPALQFLHNHYKLSNLKVKKQA